MRTSTILTLAIALAASSGTALAQSGAGSSGGPTTTAPPMTTVRPMAQPSPQANPPAPMTPPPGMTTTQPPSTATNPSPAGGAISTDAQAQARIEADGYRSVTGLTRSADGTWRGTAMRGGATVNVTVDGRGNISTQ